MKTTTATLLLKIVLVLSALAILFVAGWGVPRYMGHVTYVRPDLGVWALPMDLYGAVLAVPVLIAIVLLWRVFDTLPENEAFSLPNARRFRLIGRLALGDLALVLILAVFLIISGVMPAFILMCLLGATYVGVVAAIVFHVLAALVGRAAQLEQDNELTI